MSTPINDGGPAFPHKRQIRCNGEVIDSEMEPGMTLRDYFAGQALAAMPAEILTEEPDSVVAKASYKLADAMIAAREAKS